MPYLTLGQASEKCGKSKATILNAIRKQRMSAKKNDIGQWDIDPAELFRVYPVQTSNSSTNTKTKRGQTPSNTNENSSLQKEVEMLREQLANMKEERNEWREEAKGVRLV